MADFYASRATTNGGAPMDGFVTALHTRTYTISDMVKKSGLTLRTVRFYDERGLLSPTRVGLKRIHSEDDCLKLADLVRWRSQGFTLAEMKDALRDGGFSQETITIQIQHLRRQRDELDKAIAKLMQAEPRCTRPCAG